MIDARPGTPDDLLAISVIFKKMHADSPFFSRFEVEDDSTIDHIVNHMLTYYPDTVFGWVVEADEKIVGCCLGEVVKEPFLKATVSKNHIIWVEHKYRGTKASLKLVKEYLKWSEENADRVEFSITSGINNEGVAKLLTRLGLKKHGEYYGKEFI